MTPVKKTTERKFCDNLKCDLKEVKSLEGDTGYGYKFKVYICTKCGRKVVDR